MPYYVHDVNEIEPIERSRVAFIQKAHAIAELRKGETLHYQPSDDEMIAWRDREYKRLYGDRDGVKVYAPLPFSTPWDHFAHRAVGDNQKIAYTPDSTYGHEDRKLVTTPVRYLEKYAYLLTYSREEFQHLAAQMRGADAPMQRATTADAIGRVYTARRGPTSCMDGNNFAHDNCPTRAYAGGDLSVAYLGTLGATPEDDRIFARAVVWEAERTFVRAYGDIDAMIAALLAAGYTQKSSWRGARITAIASGRFWVVPYIDGSVQRLGERGQYLVIGEGQICGSNTDGLAAMTGSVCDHCEEHTDDGERLCSSCQDERYDCASCNEEYFGDYRTLNDDCWCPSCYRDQRRNCAHCGDRYDSAESSDSDSDYCDDCRDEIVTCESC